MLPRAIALDIETAPDPVSFGAYLNSAQRPDFQPQTADGVCKLFVDQLKGIGDKKAPELLQAFGGVERFWQLLGGCEYSALLKAGIDSGVIAGRVKLSTADLAGLKEYVDGGELAWMAEQIKRASFDPRLCRVVTVGLANDELRSVHSINECDGDEAELLRGLWTGLSRYFGNHKPCLVAYNGVEFDARVLTLRTLRHRARGLRMPWTLETLRYRYQPVADPYQYLTHWGKHTGGKGENTLLTWLRFFGIEHETKEAGMDGSQVAQYVDEGRWDEINAYCLEDAVKEWDLARVLWDEMFPEVNQARRAAAAPPQQTTVPIIPRNGNGTTAAAQAAA